MKRAHLFACAGVILAACLILSASDNSGSNAALAQGKAKGGNDAARIAKLEQKIASLETKLTAMSAQLKTAQPVKTDTSKLEQRLKAIESVVQVNGNKVKIVGSAEVEISSGSVKINGSTQVQVQAGVIKLNAGAKAQPVATVGSTVTVDGKVGMIVQGSSTVLVGP